MNDLGMAGMIAALAADGEPTSAWTALRVFGAVLLLVSIASLVTTRRLIRLQRNRAFAALLSGGWIAIVVGFLIGPNALHLIDSAMVLDLRPLLLIGLGWIGMIIGLQAKRQALKAVPDALWRWIVIDTVASIGIIGGIAWYFISTRLDGGPTWTVLPTLLLATCAIGWAAETRSIESGAHERNARLSMYIRAGAGLGAIFALLVFGLGVQIVDRELDDIVVTPMRLVTATALVFGVVLVLSAVVRDALGRMSGQRGGMLVVALGVMALTAGLAADLELSTLLASMLLGIVVGNFAATEARSFEQFVTTAEQPVAVIFYLLAGVLIDPTLGWWGWLLVMALVAARVFLKPGLMSRALGSDIEYDAKSSPLYMAPIRQSPVAIPLAVALVVMESSPLNQELLTVVVLVGLACEVLPVAIGYSYRRSEARPERTTPQPEDAA